MSSRVDHSRRALLRGRISQPTLPVRLPWVVSEDVFLNQCARCAACVDACPENIIIEGAGGYPEVDFGRGGCTFCRACVDACPEPLFRDPASSPAWFHEARVQPGCLARQGVYCESCRDACEWNAIHFFPAPNRIPVPEIEPAACTGCGFCAAACPVDAVAMGTGEAVESGR